MTNNEVFYIGYIMNKSYVVSAVISISLFITQVQAKQLNNLTKKNSINSITDLLTKNYIYPSIAEKMNVYIKKQYEEGKYTKINDSNTFAEKLTEDLQSISKDKHLRIKNDPKRVAALREEQLQPESNEIDPDFLRQAKQENFGFKEVKIIDGNIGYLNLSRFYHTSIGGDTAVSAMNFLAHTDALIIDLRKNGGGSPSMVQLITSYLYGSEPVHLNTFYKRPSDSFKQTWTLPHIQGKGRPNVPVYVLISRSSFSAAEEFSYNLRNLDRATLIGEATGGGAHSGGTEIINDQFTIWLPQGRSINPITNTDWEGVGVKPHLEVNSKGALNIAHKQALSILAEANPGEDGFKYRWYLQSLKAKNTPIKLEEKVLASYVGVYGPRTISFESGELYYQRQGRDKLKLLPIDATTFSVAGLTGFRIQVIIKNGESIALRGLTDKGSSSENPKNR
jgi:hypothetical protein